MTGGATSHEPPGSEPRDPVARNIRQISDLEHAARGELTGTERISKAITDVAGSMTFVLIHIVVFGAWTSWNGLAPMSWRFDPYPFGLMTMLVSLEGVFLATFVLITQNRMMAHTDRRDHLALQVNILTEQELTMALRLLRQLCERAGIQPESKRDEQVENLMRETNVFEVMERIDSELPRD